MNGTVKFHKPISPAFAVGEEWVAPSGLGGYNSVYIQSVTKFGDGKYDYQVVACDCFGITQVDKDAWNFQVRYNHIVDANL
jgi:hypothetical protein